MLFSRDLLSTATSTSAVVITTETINVTKCSSEVLITESTHVRNERTAGSILKKKLYRKAHLSLLWIIHV